MTIYDYNDEKAYATVIISDNKGRTFMGTAAAAPSDMDLANENTGLSIALPTAQIKAFKAKIEDKRCELKALEHLLSCISQSKFYDAKHYEAHMLHRQIAHTKQEIKTLQDLIKNTDFNIRVYIKKKDEFYQHIRKQRKGQF